MVDPFNTCEEISSPDLLEVTIHESMIEQIKEASKFVKEQEAAQVTFDYGCIAWELYTRIEDPDCETDLIHGDDRYVSYDCEYRLSGFKLRVFRNLVRFAVCFKFSDDEIWADICKVEEL